MKVLPLLAAAVGASLLGSSVLGASVLGSSVPAGTAAADPSSRQCFWSRNISGWNSLNDETLLLRVGVRDYYQLDLLPGCSGLDFAGETIGIKTRGGSDFICTGLDVQVIVPDGLPNRCDVKSVSKLTTAQVAALPPKSKP